MPSIEVKQNEPIESALRRFKRACNRDKTLQNFKKHEFYQKPSEAKKEKRKNAQKKRR